MSGFSPTAAAVILALVFFVSHYLFASVTAHATAMLPIMLTVGASVPGMPMEPYALMLALTLGIMGILTPYGTGPSPVYFGSGYLPAGDYWRLGAIFGAIYIALFLLISVPLLL
jgi:L-tartrate/succinate antiporter